MCPLLVLLLLKLELLASLSLLLPLNPSSASAVATEVPLTSEYSEHLEGRCDGGFDCDPNGPLKCVPISAIRDCIADCPNKADEKCGLSAILCDEHMEYGCGKCVRKELVNTYCSDHRWQNLCDNVTNNNNHNNSNSNSNSNYHCATTSNCVLPQWLNDGIDDCGDGSDEDGCLTGRGPCNNESESTKTTSTSSLPHPFEETGQSLLRKNTSKCLPDEFGCHNRNECIPLAYVLDGHKHCSDGSDEEFCTKFHNECASTTQKRAPCSFNPAIGRFMCGCPFGMRRTDRGICVPFNLPPNPGDCADIQRLYGSARSGIYSAYDEWKCNNSTTLCKFDVHCDMQMFGGGWTIILQRLNTSLSFERNFSDYEKGFALDEQNFWIGTNRLYRLTNRPQCPNELLLRLVASSNAATTLMRYSHFIVSNPSTGYRLNLGPLIYSNDPNGKDEMNDARMEAFETIPKWECIDGGGWWRKRCNQRGVLTASNVVDRQYRGLMWNQQRLSALQMLIRPRLFMRRNT